MTLPENPNLDDSQEEKDPGNDFEQNEGQDTGNQLPNADEADITGIDVASRASESAYTLNLEDGLSPVPEQQNDKGDASQHNIKQ